MLGSAIQLGGASITQNVFGLDTISANLILGNTLTVGGIGDLIISGQITQASGAPTAGITHSGSGALTLTAPGNQFDNLQIPSGTVEVNGGTLSLNSTTTLPGLSVGKTLIVDGGGTLDTTQIGQVVIGGTAVVPAIMDVTGASTKWICGYGTTIGVNGPGYLFVDLGASCTGPGLEVGITGTGNVMVLNGASLTTGICQIGPGADGTVTVTGAGSIWMNAGTLLLGSDGLGAVNVTNGGARLWEARRHLPWERLRLMAALLPACYFPDQAVRLA